MRFERVEYSGRAHIGMTVGELQNAGVPEPAILAAATVAIARIAEAEIDKLGDILSVSSSRSARYTDKLAEAKAYIAANRPANPAAGLYPILSAEAAARSITKSALADMIVLRGAAFTQLMALAEAQRAKVGIATASAATIDAKKAAAEAEILVFRTAVYAALAG